MDLSGIASVDSQSLLDFVYMVVNYAVGLSALLTVVSVIATGYKYMFSGGDAKKIDEANKSLAFSLLGLVLVFISPIVVKFVIEKLLSIS